MLTVIRLAFAITFTLSVLITLNGCSLLAHENSIPYIVSIEKTRLRKSTRNNQCTGMIVSREWVTTSCTCLLQMNKDDGLFTWPPAILFRLMGGVTNKKSKSALVRFAIKIRYHSKCDFELKTMDVALMKANYPFSEKSFQAGTLSPFPVASQRIDFIEAGLNTFIRRRLTCAVYGWPTLPEEEKFEFLLELRVVLVKDDECGKIACERVPALCDNNQSPGLGNYTTNTKGIGFVCAKTVNSLPPCAGFDGAPLVCGINVWATLTAMGPCNKTTLNDKILMTRLDVQFPFLKTSSPKLSSSEEVSMLWLLFLFKLSVETFL